MRRNTWCLHWPASNKGSLRTVVWPGESSSTFRPTAAQLFLLLQAVISIFVVLTAHVTLTAALISRHATITKWFCHLKRCRAWIVDTSLSARWIMTSAVSCPRLIFELESDLFPRSFWFKLQVTLHDETLGNDFYAFCPAGCNEITRTSIF